MFWYNLTSLSPDIEKLLEIDYSYLLDKAKTQGSLRRALSDIAMEQLLEIVNT